MKPWEIHWQGNVWTETSLTAAEAVDVARLVGGGWESVHPLAGPQSLVALVGVLCATRLGEPLDDALLRVQSMPAAELLGCVRELAAEPAPTA